MQLLNKEALQCKHVHYSVLLCMSDATTVFDCISQSTCRKARKTVFFKIRSKIIPWQYPICPLTLKSILRKTFSRIYKKKSVIYRKLFTQYVQREKCPPGCRLLMNDILYKSTKHQPSYPRPVISVTSDN